MGARRRKRMLPLCLLSTLLLFLGGRANGSSSSSGYPPSQLSQPLSTAATDTTITAPVIDLSCPDKDQLATQIAQACSTCGFFQVTHHGMPVELMERFKQQCELYFNLSQERKYQMKRHGSNSRGFFDDELTKQKRDWKECLDVGVPGSRDWQLADDSNLNACLDGFNQFPDVKELPDFRETVVEYFHECSKLSDQIARLMAKGLGVATQDADPFLDDLQQQHSSYLRLNYYPPCHDHPNHNHDIHKVEEDISPLGISPHKDAGFLTVLIQDDECHSLQALLEDPVDGDKWISVQPIPGALTINTGDMAQIWSNGKYKAPLHRVLTAPTKKRYSAPFFYNPGYDTFVAPATTRTSTSAIGATHKYHPLLWGYFRAVRFAGDFTDLGVEIQIDDYEMARDKSIHLDRQQAFYDENWASVPFDVDRYKLLLEKYPEETS